VAPHHLGERRCQGRHLQAPRDLDRRRDVVDRGSGLQLVEEPEPLLRERQRPLLARQALDRRSMRGLPSLQAVGQPFDGGRLEHRPHRQLDAEHGTHPRHHLGRQQRVPAEREEVLRRPHALDPQDFGEDSRHQLLGRCARCPASLLLAPLRLERCQGFAVHLAGDGHRQRVQEDVRRRHHVVRQAGRQEPAQLVGGAQRAGLQVGHERSVHHHHHRGAHRGVREQGDLDLSRLDAEAAQLDLLVQAAQIFDAAVRTEAGAVAGAVEPRARLSQRIGHEALRGQLRPLEIAAGDADAADAQLAGHP